MDDRSQWYAAGLRFECLPTCSACCSDHGEYTAVYLNESDVRDLADFLGMTREEFVRRHTTFEEGALLMKMDPPDCLFLEAGRCKVYEARPMQCRTFPFWEENLKSRTAWTRLREFCPGIDVGELHDHNRIQEHLDDRKSST
jgi:Fe-S-cluster containining protein